MVFMRAWECMCGMCVLRSAPATLLTHAAQSGVLEGQHTAGLERLVGLSDGVGYLRRDASTWQGSPGVKPCPLTDQLLRAEGT
jgi:hypothetical protein